MIAGNDIGTGVHGAAAVPNGAGGVLINAGASNNLIGTDGSSSHADEGNLISGNNAGGTPGVMISDTGTNSNVVAGNLIGTDAGGQNPLGNGGVGVFILNGAQSNRIGTDGDGKGDSSERNVIADNGYQGVYIGGTGTDFNVVAGNLIGVDSTGENAMGNGNNGIWISAGARSNRIGVSTGHLDTAAEANVISANSFSGVRIDDPGTNFNVVAGNFIGTDVNGTAILGNGSDAVTVAGGAQSNTIGGTTSSGNTIRGNVGNGVGVFDGATTGNTIRFNAMRGNGGLGIDLGGDGVTPDHGNTTAPGPNNLENYPNITSAGYGTTTTVGISFIGLPNDTYAIDFYNSGRHRSDRLRRRPPLSRHRHGDDRWQWAGRSAVHVQPPGEHQPGPVAHRDGHRSGREYLRVLAGLGSLVALVAGDRSPLRRVSNVWTVAVLHRDGRGVRLRPADADGHHPVPGGRPGVRCARHAGRWVRHEHQHEHSRGRIAYDRRGLFGRLELHHRYGHRLADDRPGGADDQGRRPEQGLWCRGPDPGLHGDGARRRRCTFGRQWSDPLHLHGAGGDRGDAHHHRHRRLGGQLCDHGHRRPSFRIPGLADRHGRPTRVRSTAPPTRP